MAILFIESYQTTAKRGVNVMSRVIHFEIETRNPEKKMSFYEEVFGWKFQEMMEGYWIIITGEDGEEGIDGGLMRSSTEEALRTVNSITVADLDEYLRKVERAGGKVTSAKMEIPEIGDFAYCEDSEGLSFGVIQFFKKE